MKSLFSSSWCLALIGGSLTGLAYLPWFSGIIAWFSFIPLLYIWLNNNAKHNMWSGFIFGIAHNLISYYWIGNNSGASKDVVLLSLIAAVLYLSIYWAVAGWVFGKVKNRENGLILFPLLIVTMEFIRSYGPLGFPWGNIVLSQIEFLSLIQFLELTGSYGVTLLIISINVIIYSLITDFNYNVKNSIIFTVVLFGILIFGQSRIKKYNNISDYLSVVIVQPNIDPNLKWDINKKDQTLLYLDSLHFQATELVPDLIVFPETAFPTYLKLDRRIRRRIQHRVDTTGIPVLIGTVDRVLSTSGIKKYYNSTMFLSPKEDYVLYNKIHLVPFAEYIPFSNKFRYLENLNFGQGNFSHGFDYTIFNWNEVNFSNLICYESSIPSLVRKFVQNGAQFITIQTNDGWLGNSAGPHQHFDIARIRAIENRIPIIRSANTGISGLILPNGRSISEQALGKTAIIKVQLPLGISGSFYSQYGDVFATILLVIFVFIGSTSWLKIKL